MQSLKLDNMHTVTAEGLFGRLAAYQESQVFIRSLAPQERVVALMDSGDVLQLTIVVPSAAQVEFSRFQRGEERLKHRGSATRTVPYLIREQGAVLHFPSPGGRMLQTRDQVRLLFVFRNGREVMFWPKVLSQKGAVPRQLSAVSVFGGGRY